MIDEKKLLEDLEKEIEFAKKCNMPQMVAGMNQVKSIIENQPKVGEWIPVSERLPEDARNVLVTFKGSKTATEAFYSKHLDGWYSLPDGENIEVIAWADKPEPYREDE